MPTDLNVKRTMLDGLDSALSDGMLAPAETPVYMRDALDSERCHVFRSGDVVAVVKKGWRVLVKRKDGREVVLDLGVLRMLVSPFGAVVPHHGGAVPRLQGNPANTGRLVGTTLVSLTVDGHDGRAGIFVDEDAPDTLRRVVAAWNATRGMALEDLEKLAR